MNHAYLSQLIFNTPLIISERKLQTILSVLGPRFEGRVLADVDGGPSIPIGRTAEHSPSGQVALISILGSLVNRTFGMEAWSGLESYHNIRQQLQAAMDDDSINGIILDIDSPGGEVSGCFDLADMIHEASQQKPILALVDEGCFSAAYALASAANRIVLPRTGAVGSVGVLAVHMDQSEADKQNGLKFSFVKAGALKDDMNPHAPLKSEARERLQSEVDRVYGIFVDTVARNRGMSVEAVRKTEAGIFFGQDAVDIGFADAIESRQEAIMQFIEDIGPKQVYGDKKIKFSGQTEGGKIMGKSEIVKQTEQETKIEGKVEDEKDMDLNAASVVMATKKNALQDKVKVETESLPDGHVSASYVAEIMQICNLAGKPSLAAKFIEKKMSSSVVVNALLEARAQEDDALDIAGKVPPSSTKPVVAQVEPVGDIYARRAKEISGKV